MNWRKKNLLYLVILAASLLVVVFARNKEKPEQESLLAEGYTMGTTYRVVYFDEQHRDFKRDIDSLLELVNKSINNYDTASEVSRFNRGKSFVFDLPYFYPPLKKGLDVFQESDGAFDLTVMPLVNAWGFGPEKNIQPDSARIDSLRRITGSEKLNLSLGRISKTDDRVQLDFGGIGQGYGADVIAEFLRSQGVSDMLVELGGEGIALGSNLKSGKSWTIGILDPRSTRETQFFKAYVTLVDRAFTTSGNYFNYREIDGKRFSHSIDPKTGYPANHAILSASVLADDCTTADAWATAFMVMGHEKAIAWLQQHHELDAIIMYSSANASIDLFITDGIKSNVIVEQDSL
jgi:FAD:protein FMN transferase